MNRDIIYRQAAIDAVTSLCDDCDSGYCGDCRVNIFVEGGKHVRKVLEDLPSAQPAPFVDADKLKRCRFEYINACKIVARPTPDTSKNDIYDANAVIKALYPIFGDAEF